MNNIKHWVFVIGKFFTSQGVIKFIDFITAMLILRFLPINEYALYIVFSFLLSIGSIGSDFGLSQAVTTIGAKIKDEQTALGSLFSTAKNYKRNLYLITTIVILIIVPFITKGHNWGFINILSCIIVILLSNWFSQTVSLRTSVLNIHHDIKGLFEASGMTSITRLALVLIICKIWPFAITALIVNLIGYIISDLKLFSICKKHLNEQVPPLDKFKKELKEFIFPLIPGVIYFIFQGQISICLLSVFGHTTPIAQVGALGRLGQIIDFIGIINPFFIQPYFARLTNKREFIVKSSLVLLFLIFISIFVLGSSVIVPHWWLIVLGKKYNNLTLELPIALISSLLFLISATVYTLLISQKATQWQSLSIIISICIQLFFIITNGVHNTFDALLLNALTNGAYLSLQLILLAKMLFFEKTKEN